MPLSILWPTKHGVQLQYGPHWHGDDDWNLIRLYFTSTRTWMRVSIRRAVSRPMTSLGELQRAKHTTTMLKHGGGEYMWSFKKTYFRLQKTWEWHKDLNQTELRCKVVDQNKCSYYKDPVKVLFRIWGKNSSAHPIRLNLRYLVKENWQRLGEHDLSCPPTLSLFSILCWSLT